MMKRKRLLTTYLLVMSMFVCFAGNSLATESKKPPQPGLSEESISSRINNLTRLINTSSGAKRVSKSGNAKALAKQEEANRLLEQGKSALNAGDLKAANGSLDKATKTIFEAIRLIGSGKSKEQKKKDDFKNRAESIDVLLDALSRIAGEKGSKDQASQKIAQIQSKVSQAQALENRGELDAGRKKLDEAFVEAKTAVVTLREGDTLVRSLDFKNKEEEYEYEIDRNNTHKMLVQILLQEKMKKASVKKMVDKFLTKSASLRSQAEKEAASGDHASAVKTLELSTKELVKAIRGAGVYIPG